MNIREAYIKLDLEPPMEFMEKARSPRRNGATTWMLVEAALTVLKCNDVFLVGHNPHYSRTLGGLCCDTLLTLKPGIKITEHAGRFVVGDYGSVWFGTEKKLQSKTVVFHDFNFQAALWEHQRGPFANIRKLVRQKDGSFKSFDNKGTFVLELTKEGGEELYNLDWNRISVG